MNYENHFLKEHISTAEKERDCILDLCHLISVNVERGNMDLANRYKNDLLKSLESLTDMNKFKVEKDAWLKWKQIESEHRRIHFEKTT